MGRNMDESMLSIASTLVDSCAASVDESVDDENEQGDNKAFVCRGQIIDDKKANSKLASPTTTAITLEITESKSVKSERTTESKLEKIRAKNKRLRELGKKTIEESRASLRKSRTLLGPPPANPPPYPPPSVHNKAKEARLNPEAFKHNPNAEFSEFLKRSNSVIDQLATEIAMAGNIINQSVDADTTFNDSVANKTNDFASNLCAGRFYSQIGKDEKSIQNDENSIHNISVGEDWDQTTISATLEGTPSNSLRERSIKVPSIRPPSQSGLPPPEVVVKRVTPRAPPQAQSTEADISFNTTASTVYPVRSTVDRHLRQRPPSIYSSRRGDCESMYNTNQKVEKLALENDCLKRQLDLLESRHRDSERKFYERMQVDEISEEDQPGTILSSSKTSITKKKYTLNRKKKKWSERRKLAVMLLLGPFLISSIIWLYQTNRSVPTNGSAASDSIKITNMMREGVLGNSAFGETSDTMFSNDAENEETYDYMDDFDDKHLVVHDPLDFEADGEPTSGKKKLPRFKRILSRLKFSNKNDEMGAWHENHRKTATKKLHAEL